MWLWAIKAIPSVVADSVVLCKVVIVTLRDPVYNAAAATLSYNVTFVPGRHVGSIANFYRRHKSAPAFTKVRSASAPVLQTRDPFQILLCRSKVDHTILSCIPPCQVRGSYLAITCCWCIECSRWPEMCNLCRRIFLSVSPKIACHEKHATQVGVASSGDNHVCTMCAGD